MNNEQKKAFRNDPEIYWNHNTAYHKWILSQVKGKDKVLDVGCGDGLLVHRLAGVCGHVIGIDNHAPSIERAKNRLRNLKNAQVVKEGLEDFKVEPNSFDAVIFVASLHHMDLGFCIDKSIELLKPNGRLLVVGLARPHSILDSVIEFGRILPAKFGDLFHDVKGDVGAPIADWGGDLGDIRAIVKLKLPNAKIRQALYYRYLLNWTKPKVL